MPGQTAAVAGPKIVALLFLTVNLDCRMRIIFLFGNGRQHKHSLVSLVAGDRLHLLHDAALLLNTSPQPGMSPGLPI
ncbi:MAG TPA: hypothetical protein VLA83_05460 [Candidatus Binatia bacterium]|nr:hypothetical protein [Candidatus Binatia bacterium]